MKLQSFCILVAFLVVQTHSLKIFLSCDDENGDYNCKNEKQKGLPVSVPNEEIQLLCVEKYSEEIHSLKLELASNRFPKEIFTKLPNLHKLKLRIDQIKKFSENDLEGADELMELEIVANKITTIPANILSKAPKVQKFTMNGAIKEIATGAFTSTELIELDLSNNQLTSLKLGMFSGATNLKKLDVSTNEITDIEGNTFDLPMVKYIGIQNNKLRTLHLDLFQKAPNLKELRVSHNDFVNVPSCIKSLQKLEYLHFSESFKMTEQIISNLPLWPMLKELDLCRTKQTSLDFEGEHNLKTLDLSDCGLNYSDLLTRLEKFKNLETLVIEGNKLTKLDRFKEIKLKFPNLKKIYLGRNWFKDDTLKSMEAHCKGRIEFFN